ncbi:MAG: hypothetical protein BWY31_04470 [Lentisphaerae bacterium ADurb.Bin242]|nr:MAG: hypothetical protein BWY31_04470 [Lentisphaerae bacterium ADurb.Bin242]
MKESFGNVLRIGERRTEAVAPDVDQQVGALPRAHGIAVDAHDSGHRASVGIQRGGAVVRLDLVDQVELVVEGDHARVVGEHGDQPVDFLRNLRGAFLDIGFEEGNDLLLLSVFILITDFGVENFVLAMLGPGLRQHFQFHVGRVLPEPELLASSGVAEIVLDGFHLVQRQGQDSLAADLQQFFVGDLQVELADDPRFGSLDQRFVEGNSVRPYLGGGKDRHRFDQFVDQHGTGDSEQFFLRQGGRLEQIFDRAENQFILAELAPDDVADRLVRGARHVVGHAGAEADRRDEVISDRGILRFADHPILSHGAGQFAGDPFRFLRRNIGADRENVPRAQIFHNVQPGEVPDGPHDGLTA